MKGTREESAVAGVDGDLDAVDERRSNVKSPENASQGNIERVLRETRTRTRPAAGAEDEVVALVGVGHGGVLGAVQAMVQIAVGAKVERTVVAAGVEVQKGRRW